MSNFNSFDVTELFVGDIIQGDRSVLVVEAVGTKTADCVPLGDQGGALRRVANPFPRRLIVERGRLHKLAQAVGRSKSNPALQLPTSPKAKGNEDMNGMVTLEPGDALCYHNKVCCVLAVTDDRATLGDADGNEYAEPRRMNEVFFDFADCGKPGCTVRQRFDAEQRAAFLKTFLATRKPPGRAEQTNQQQPSGGDKETEVMAKKAKGKKARKAKTAKVKASNGSNARLGEIHGFSIGSVINRLGAEGVRTAEACRILEGQKIEAKKQTVAWNINEGTHGRGKAAELTKDQIKDLKATATPEPAE